MSHFSSAPSWRRRKQDPKKVRNLFNDRGMHVRSSLGGRNPTLHLHPNREREGGGLGGSSWNSGLEFHDMKPKQRMARSPGRGPFCCCVTNCALGGSQGPMPSILNSPPHSRAALLCPGSPKAKESPQLGRCPRVCMAVIGAADLWV